MPRPLVPPEEVAEEDEGLLPEIPGSELDEEMLEQYAERQPVDSEASAETPPATVPEAQPAKSAKINLDDSPEFRKFKAEADKRVADAQKRAADAEARAAQNEAVASQQLLREMQAALDEAADDGQRQAIIGDMVNLQAQETIRGERRWQSHVISRATEEGVDPNQFDPLAYRGEAGGMQFERDLAVAARDKLQGELREARRLADPVNMQRTIAQEVAKALRSKGVDSGVETGGGAGDTDNGADALARDIQLLNQGKLKRGAFAQRWGAT